MSNEEPIANLVGLMTSFHLEIKALPDDLKCAKCKSVLKNACQVPCGCRLCRTCIDEVISSGDKFSPGGSQECGATNLSTALPDHRTYKSVWKLIAKCPHAGCSHECPLADLEDHLRLCLRKTVDYPFSPFYSTNSTLDGIKMSGHLLQESCGHSEIMIGTVANISSDMEMLKRDVLLKDEDMENAMKLINDEIKSIKDEVKSIIIEKKSFKEKNESIKEENKSIKDENKSIKDENKSIKDENKSIKNLIKAIKDEMKSIKIENESIKRQKEVLCDRVRQLAEKLEREIDERSSNAAPYMNTNGNLIEDKTIYVGPAMKKAEQSGVGNIFIKNPTIPCASLYVADLHPDVTEAILYDKFQTHGNVLSIRVCRDLVTKKSLGYAYVNYQDSAEAKSAMDNINFEDIHGRPCRIMWSQRDPAAKRSGVGNIFIKNLDPSITVKEINDTFANFGEISSCKVQTDENGVSKGFAFVNFNREEDAEKAIEAINGKIIREKIVYVAKFIPRTHSKDFTNCYIKNCGTHLVDKTLKEMFEHCGEIVSAKVMVDKDGNSKGFGFVSFKEHEAVNKAVNAFNGKVIEDKTIYVGRAMKKAERERELRARYEKTRQERLQQHKSGVNIYIKNLGNDLNDERLRGEFIAFGNITSAKVMLNKENNTSKGFGLVCFSAPEEATRAVSEMNGKIVDGKPLYVALAQKKEDRVAHLRSQFQQRVHQPQPAVFNTGMMNFMMNTNAQRPFMARPGNILQNRWPPNVAPYMQPRNNIVGMPANQNIMMTGLPPQNTTQRRNIMVDPLMTQNRKARSITGNVQMNQARPQYNIVANGRPTTINPMYQYPMQDGSGPQPMIGADQIKMTDMVESQIDLSTTSKIANADSMEAKQLLGEKIYPLVSKHAGDMAGKITGMFLELDNAELLYMIENENSLRMKIDEALLVLNAHKSGEGERSGIHD